MKDAAVRKRFFQLVDQLKITRIDFLCLTHPHYDHYAGMGHVIEYFTSGGRSIGVFCDAGINPLDVEHMLKAKGRPAGHVSEYISVMSRLDDLFNKQIISYRTATEGTYPLTNSPCQVIPVAPEAGLPTRMTRQIGMGVRPAESLNSLSVQLLIRVNVAGGEAQVLLTGDADTPDIERAMAAWKVHRENPTGTQLFEVVKVPHHGSKRGHWPGLCGMKKPSSKGLAVISADTQYRLPKKPVISEYLNSGWITLCTTTRRSKGVTGTLLNLFGKGPAGEYGIRRQTVQMSIYPGGAISWQPPAAEVKAGDLVHYFD